MHYVCQKNATATTVLPVPLDRIKKEPVDDGYPKPRIILSKYFLLKPI